MTFITYISIRPCDTVGVTPYNDNYEMECTKHVRHVPVNTEIIKMKNHVKGAMSHLHPKKYIFQILHISIVLNRDTFSRKCVLLTL